LSPTEGFSVEVQNDHIFVTFVSTSFCVDYPKPKKGKACRRRCSHSRLFQARKVLEGESTMSTLAPS
jgi:hypothetical protein